MFRTVLRSDTLTPGLLKTDSAHIYVKAFPGFARRAGFRTCFSDFNREVIERVTVPNVRLNVPEHHQRLAEYYCGDWSSLSPLLYEARGMDK